MKIIDRDGKTLGACAVFEHRGYQISCSTLPTYGEIAVFHPSLGFLKAFTATPKGFGKAVAYINRRANREVKRIAI